MVLFAPAQEFHKKRQALTVEHGPEQISLSHQPKISLYDRIISQFLTALATAHSHLINDALVNGVWVNLG